jgi:hypothetical protein
MVHKNREQQYETFVHLAPPRFSFRQSPPRNRLFANFAADFIDTDNYRNRHAMDITDLLINVSCRLIGRASNGGYGKLTGGWPEGSFFSTSG